MGDRLTMTDDGMVRACPECDEAGNIYRRSGTNAHTGNPDDPCVCYSCGATFEEPVARDPKPRGGGTNAKYADLTLEDVGLAPHPDD